MNDTNHLPEICISSLNELLQPDLFKALCDPVRILIIATLATKKEPITVSEIADCCAIDFSGISRHLKILKVEGIVNAERHGRSVLYQLDMNMLTTTLRGVADSLEICRDNAE